MLEPIDYETPAEVTEAEERGRAVARQQEQLHRKQLKELDMFLENGGYWLDHDRTAHRPRLAIPRSATSIMIAPQVTNDFAAATNKLSAETKFLNMLGIPVRVIFRNGLSAVVPPACSPLNGANSGKSFNNGTFCADVRHMFARDVNIDMQHLSSVRIADGNLDEFDAYELSLRSCHQGHQNGFSHRYTYSRELLDKGQGEMYCSEIDVIVTTDLSIDAAVVHPRTIIGSYVRGWKEQPFGFMIRVDIVDNEGEFGDRWFNPYGVPFKCAAIVDLNKPSGIHIYTCDPKVPVGRDGSPKTIVHLFGFNEAHLIPLYLTRAEALIHGSRADVYKQEQEDKKHEQAMQVLEIKKQLQEMQGQLDAKSVEVKQKEQEYREREAEIKNNDLAFTKEQLRMKQEHEIMEHKHKLELGRLKRDALILEESNRKEAERLDHEKATRDRESLHEREQWERRSASRKDVSEILKWIPSMVASVAAVAVLVIKTSSTAKG